MSRRRKRGGPSGFLLVDKQPGLTSHDVVARLRRRFDTPRVGHAGTLDPDATGLLLVGIGTATRLLSFLVGLDKIYEATIELGSSTDTQDAAGKVTATFDMGEVDGTAVRVAAESMLGESDQVPPMVSAVRVGGRRLHEIAREGREVERAPRRIRVDRFDIVATHPGSDAPPATVDAVVACSSGTYVRTLAHDLGIRLGGGAHLRTLRRTRVGPYEVSEAMPWESALLRPTVDAVRPMTIIPVGEAHRTDLGHGRPIDRGALGIDDSDDGPWSLVADDRPDTVLAVYEPFRAGLVKPAVVLAGS